MGLARQPSLWQANMPLTRQQPVPLQSHYLQLDYRCRLWDFPVVVRWCPRQDLRYTSYGTLSSMVCVVLYSLYGKAQDANTDNI